MKTRLLIPFLVFFVLSLSLISYADARGFSPFQFRLADEMAYDDLYFYVDGSKSNFRVDKGETATFPLIITSKHSAGTVVDFHATIGNDAIPVNFFDPPLKFARDGVEPKDIPCRNALILILRYDGAPSCVHEDTKPRLIERGWMKTQVNVHNNEALIEGTKNLNSVQYFLSLYPDAEISIDKEWYTVTYAESGFIEESSSRYEPIRTKSLILSLDYDGKLMPFSIMCGGPISLSIHELEPLLEHLHDPDWCFPFDQSQFNLLDKKDLENENTLRPDDRLEVRHSAGYTTVSITLSSWDEYYEWEKDRGAEHDAMPPIIIDDNNIDPIVLDLLNEMWKFENYEVSKYDKTLFIKIVQKDYSVPNHHGIHDWLESEYEKQFGKSNDGFSNHFEYEDRVYSVSMLAVD